MNSRGVARWPRTCFRQRAESASERNKRMVEALMMRAPLHGLCHCCDAREHLGRDRRVGQVRGAWPDARNCGSDGAASPIPWVASHA